jgi:hypothetical protein
MASLAEIDGRIASLRREIADCWVIIRGANQTAIPAAIARLDAATRSLNAALYEQMLEEQRLEAEMTVEERRLARERHAIAEYEARKREIGGRGMSR